MSGTYKTAIANKMEEWRQYWMWEFCRPSRLFYYFKGMSGRDEYAQAVRKWKSWKPPRYRNATEYRERKKNERRRTIKV